MTMLFGTMSMIVGFIKIISASPLPEPTFDCILPLVQGALAVAGAAGYLPNPGGNPYYDGGPYYGGGSPYNGGGSPYYGGGNPYYGGGTPYYGGGSPYYGGGSPYYDFYDD